MKVVERSDPDFADACFGPLFNARKPDERVPAAVAFPESERDVVDAVRLARERGRQVTVRSGGHSWAGWSVRDDALLIDLGRMRDMTCDGEIARANPAVRGGLDLAPFLASRGRMFPGGHCESVGIGGFLLQAGQGWNSRRWGWGCENVVGVDVVTADGELVRGDEELLWAARGAGPGFPGVVTRFHLRTYPMAPMFHDTRIFRLDDIQPLLEFMHDVMPRLDVAVEPVIAATRLRTGEVELLLHTTLAAASAAEADRLFAPLDAVPVEPVEQVRGPTTIAEENTAQAQQNPPAHRYCADCQWSNASAAELAPLLRDIWSELPTRHSFSIWYGWAPKRPLPDMAFSLEANVYVATYAIWTDPADDERHRSWVHDHYAHLAAQVGAGVYIGDTDFGRRPDRFMADDNFRRLQEIRARRDPDDLFPGYLVAAGAEVNRR